MTIKAMKGRQDSAVNLNMNIPYDQLNPDTLRAIIEEFVTRDGTDYGEEEAALEDKIDQVLEQLKQGKAVLTYDEKTQTCNIVEGKCPE